MDHSPLRQRLDAAATRDSALLKGIEGRFPVVRLRDASASP